MTQYVSKFISKFLPDNKDTSLSNNSYHYSLKDKTDNISKPKKGLDEVVVRMISASKQEPLWMLDYRLRAYHQYLEKPLPSWGVDLSELNFDDIYYYLKPKVTEQKKWSDVPDDIKNTFEKLGIPQAEKEMLAGVKSQYDSEVIYGSLQTQLAKQGVIFLSMDEGLKQYPEIVKKYFASVVGIGDNKFASLNTAVWSGGSFLYVPENVEVELPLQAYFRINSKHAGQFERTLIIVEKNAKVHYVEGCSAPAYTDDALHSAVVEVIVKENAHCQYTTIQNWYPNVYNLVTKRAKVETQAKMYWVDGNLGSKVTAKYPCCVLAGEKAHGEMLSIAFAKKGQILDSGAKMIHLASDTTSQIVSKSISMDGGRSSYRGIVQVTPRAYRCRSKVNCDALILDNKSRSDTYPTNQILNTDTILEHEATVSKISQEQLFYLQSRGLSEKQASSVIIAGFLEPIVSQLPMEYAIELNRLIELEMEGAVG